jgi:hypothetical protein
MHLEHGAARSLRTNDEKHKLTARLSEFHQHGREKVGLTFLSTPKRTTNPHSSSLLPSRWPLHKKGYFNQPLKQFVQNAGGISTVFAFGSWPKCGSKGL